MGSITPLPYWQINMSPSLRTPTCPPFLQNLSPKDLSIISTPDTSYRPLSWAAVKAIIAKNNLSAFQRLPSDLRRYLAYMHDIKEKHGSIMTFILRERLCWDEREVGKEMEMGGGFEREGNWKILCNDWPYGIDARIVHLVVWTKFELEDDDEGMLSQGAREMIDGFVGEKFIRVCGVENVIWFKNWKSLKSVHAVEHFHVMLFYPDPRFVNEITNGDVPLCQKV